MIRRQKLALTSQQTRAFLQENRLESAAANAFAFRDAAGLRYALHAHRRHQLLYATSGTASLEVLDATFVLPPQRAAFIPAGTRHVTNMGSAQGISLFFDSRWCVSRRRKSECWKCHRCCVS